MLVVFLPLLGVFDPKAVGKDLANGLQRHALAFGIAEDDEDPSDGANAAIEAECARGSKAFHHTQECRGDDYVR